MIDSINYCSGLGSSDHLCLNFSLSCCPKTKGHFNNDLTYNFNKGDVQIELDNVNHGITFYNICVWPWTAACIPKCQKLTHRKAGKNKWVHFTGHHLDHLRFRHARNSLRSLMHVSRVKHEPIMTLVKSTLFDDCQAVKRCLVTQWDAEYFLCLRYYTISLHFLTEPLLLAQLDGITIGADIMYDKLSNLQSDKAAGQDNLFPRVQLCAFHSEVTGIDQYLQSP